MTDDNKQDNSTPINTDGEEFDLGFDTNRINKDCETLLTLAKTLSPDKDALRARSRVHALLSQCLFLSLREMGIASMDLYGPNGDRVQVTLNKSDHICEDCEAEGKGAPEEPTTH